MAIGRGRPTKYTVEIGEEICSAIATSERGLIHLVDANPHWPNRSTIFLWKRKHKEFSDSYEKAKEDQTEVVFDYMQELIDEPHRILDPETGLIKIDVPMLKLKVETMKWQSAKLKPKKYGDAKTQEVVNNEVDEDCKRRMQEMDEKNRKEF